MGSLLLRRIMLKAEFLDQQLIRHPSATTSCGQLIAITVRNMQGALLVVDSSLTPVDGSLLVRYGGEYRIKRYRKYPRQHTEDLSTGRKRRYQ